MKIERTVGSGRHSVYVYYFPSLASGDQWPCKIGRAKNAIKRIKQQQASMHEEPVIGLLINTDWPIAIESMLHERLKESRLPTYGEEWFCVSPSIVEQALATCGVDSLPIGDQVRVNRSRMGLTQAALAKMAGVRQATISKLESGDGGTPIRVLQKVLKAMNLSLKAV